jgi:hypothetical protein
VDVDPVVREQVRRVEDQGNDQEVTVAQLGGGRDDLGRRGRVESLDHVAQRHGADEVLRLDPLAADAVGSLDARLDGADAAPLALNTLDPGAHAHLPALVADAVAHLFPEHAGTEPGILELLDEADRVVGTGERVPDRLHQRKVLDPLRRPIRLDLVGRDPPDLVGVAAEEVEVEAASEAVDDPILERLLLLVGAHLPLEVAEHDTRRFVDAKVAERVKEFQGIVEVAPSIVNPAEAWNLNEVVAHDLVPYRLNFGYLREEAMAANVKAIAVVAFGARDSAHKGAGLQHNRFVSASEPLKLISRRQTSRAAADDRDVAHKFLIPVLSVGLASAAPSQRSLKP